MILKKSYLKKLIKETITEQDDNSFKDNNSFYINKLKQSNTMDKYIRAIVNEIVKTTQVIEDSNWFAAHGSAMVDKYVKELFSQKKISEILRGRS